jgi:hypothetical protein
MAGRKSPEEDHCCARKNCECGCIAVIRKQNSLLWQKINLNFKNKLYFWLLLIQIFTTMKRFIFSSFLLVVFWGILNAQELNQQSSKKYTTVEPTTHLQDFEPSVREIPVRIDETQIELKGNRSGKKIFCIPMGGYSTVTRGPSYFYSDDPDTFFLIAANSNNVYAGTWANGQWLGANATDFTLVSIDTLTGNMTSIGSTGSIQFNGMAYDVLDSVLFAVSSTDLYSLDISTGASTLIGSCGITSSVFINLACSPSGVLYSVNMSDDILYSINKTTGAATPIGTGIGINLNYAQDMEYDFDENILYIAAYEGGGVSSWRTIDVSTGVVSASLGACANAELCALAIPYTYIPQIDTYPVTFEVNNGNGNLVATVDGNSIQSGDLIEAGKDVEFVATPDNHYEIKEWTLNGIIIPSFVLSSYTLSGLNDTSHVSVEFIMIDTTSVQYMEQATVKVFPNPVTDIMHIIAEDNYELKVFDVLGREIISAFIKRGNDNINLSSIENGVYFLTFEGKSHYSMKIVKN